MQAVVETLATLRKAAMQARSLEMPAAMAAKFSDSRTWEVLTTAG